jgi:acetylornithine deacetylase
VVSVLADLVALPSVNPLHEAAAMAPFGEARVANYVEAFASSLDLPVRRQAVLAGRDNVLITLAGSEPGRELIFECHMDTVPGWEGKPGPFEPRLAQGKLYGRGACDVKGTLTAMLLALRLLVHQRLVPARTVILAATVDEEHQARGVNRLAASVRAEAAVVGEPTNLALAIAHKGCVRWRVTTRGRSVHSSKAFLGVNAVDAMVDFLGDLRQASEPVLARRSHPLVGAPTLSVCTIRGGVAVNVIPDLCAVELDRRTVPGEALADVVSEFAALVRDIAAKHPQLDVAVEPPFVVDPALGTDPDASIVRDLARAVEATVGSAAILGVPYGTDASKLSEVGIPSVVFGPGNIDVAHTTDEHVDVAEVARASEILALLALDRGSSK